MSQFQGWIILFIVFLILTAFCSYIGDDDVVYQFLNRKPTPREGLVRIRWVMLKAITSIYGGCVLASLLFDIIIRVYRHRIPIAEVVLFSTMCMGIVSLLIGVLQNEIRRLPG